MGIHIWCLLAPMFLVSVNAGFHNTVSRSLYETSQYSSPRPTQFPQTDLTGMKGFVLYLTPDQVETLQAAGAVVQPYPEYETNFRELQEQFRLSIEQQNEQQYQAWRNPSVGEKYNPELQNYHKLLNIQEINDDLAHTQATEGTTEKITKITPRYKYTRTKSRQQYKDKELSTPYAHKKTSQTNISNQNNNMEYVRFLPNIEKENLQIIAYQPLPLSPYQLNEDQANVYNQTDEKAQPALGTIANTEAQQNAYSQDNKEAQQTAYTEANTEAQQNAHIQVNKQAPQTAHTVASTEAQNNVYSQENMVGQKNAYPQVNKEAQPVAYTVANKKAQQNAYSQENIVAQQNVYIQVSKEAQQTANTAHTVASTEAQHNVYDQENIVNQQNAYTQVNKEAQPTVYTVANTDTQQNAYSQENKVAQQNAYNQVKVEAQSNAYIEPNTETRQNSFSQANKEGQRNRFKPYVPARVQVEKDSENPQVVVEVPVPKVTEKPVKVQTYHITQDTTEFKETLSSIEGLPPLPPLATTYEEQQEKPETSASLIPTAKSPIVHQDKFSLLLAPLYQHQRIESITRQKEELVKNEFKIRSKLQQMKESQYYDHEEYTTAIEKLAKIFGQQNALAKIEATSISNSPAAFLNQESESTGSHPTELVRSTEFPMLVRIPKPHDLKIPVPYPVASEFMLPSIEPKPLEGGKRGPFKGMRNFYVKVENPVIIPINSPEQLKIIRHIWEH